MEILYCLQLFVHLKLFLIKGSFFKKKYSLESQKEPHALIFLSSDSLLDQGLLHTYYTFYAGRLSYVLRVWCHPLIAAEKDQPDASLIEVPAQMPVWMETRLLCELRQVNSVSVLSFRLIISLLERRQCLPSTSARRTGGFNINMDMILTACSIHSTEYLYQLFGSVLVSRQGSSGQNLHSEMQQTHWSPFINNDILPSRIPVSAVKFRMCINQFFSY